MAKVKTKIMAVGYIRVSGKGQVKGTGPRRQQEAICDYAKQAGAEIVTWYREAHTGTEAKRPVFNAMLEALLSNGADTIIVESLDRLARDLSVQLTLVAFLASRGLTLLSASTGQDVTAAMRSDPMQKAMVQIQGTFAELDKSLTVQKLRKARESIRAERGRCEGRKPFGFRLGEAETLKRIKQLRRKPKDKPRRGYYQIASILNKEGRKSRMGKPWQGMTVKQILERIT